ncbi:response regulator, partial [Reichenbachiella sp.]
MRALIIDDEKQAREGVKILLSSVSEVQLLDEAKDGEEAIEKINSLKPDLIFLDVQMPGINGFDV